jgi:hypothetical protein
MKFSTKADIQAPVEGVFEMLCDFENFERAAMRRGADVRRVDELDAVGVGMIWQAVFDLRGKRRDVRVELVGFERPSEMVIDSRSNGLDGAMRIDAVALTPTHTQIKVELEITPQNLSARLLVQSLKLAKASLNRKYKLRVADYAKSIEDRYRRQA